MLKNTRSTYPARIAKAAPHASDLSMVTGVIRLVADRARPFLSPVKLLPAPLRALSRRSASRSASGTQKLAPRGWGRSSGPAPLRVWKPAAGQLEQAPDGSTRAAPGMAMAELRRKDWVGNRTVSAAIGHQSATSSVCFVEREPVCHYSCTIAEQRT